MRIPLTVALLTYNRAGYLKEAIEGIQNQTYRNFEFLILDNGSTDDTPSVVLGTKDDRIRYIRNPPGCSASFNNVSAIKLARGERVIVTHDDDIMEPEMLETQMAVLNEHHDMTAIWTNTSTIDQHGQLIQKYLTPPGNDRIYQIGEYISSFPSDRLWPLPSTLIFTRKLFPEKLINGIYYDEKSAKRRSRRSGGDVLLPAVMNTKGSVAFLNKPLLRYRQHGPQETNRLNLSEPVLCMYEILGKLAGQTPGGNTDRPILASYIARYKAQHELIYTQTPQVPSRLLTRLYTLFDRAIRDIQGNSEACYPLLPLMVFLAQNGKCDVLTTLETIAPPNLRIPVSPRRCSGGPG